MPLVLRYLLDKSNALEIFFLLLASTFIAMVAVGQNSFLQINHKLEPLTKIIEEGKRVQVKVENERLSFGKLKILNDFMISVKDDVMNIADIDFIKINPLGLNIIEKLIFAGGGVFIMVVGSWAIWLFIGLESGISTVSVLSALVAVSGLTLTTVGLLQCSTFSKKLYRYNWNYKVIS